MNSLENIAYRKSSLDPVVEMKVIIDIFILNFYVFSAHDQFLFQIEPGSDKQVNATGVSTISLKSAIRNVCGRYLQIDFDCRLLRLPIVKVRSSWRT